MTRSERRTMSGMARLMPNRRERVTQILSYLAAETGKAIPELLLGALVFGFLFLIMPIAAMLLSGIV